MYRSNDHSGGLPSVARKRIEQAKSLLSELIVIILRLACRTKLRRMNAEFSLPSRKASAGGVE